MTNEALRERAAPKRQAPFEGDVILQLGVQLVVTVTVDLDVVTSLSPRS